MEELLEKRAKGYLEKCLVFPKEKGTSIMSSDLQDVSLFYTDPEGKVVANLRGYVVMPKEHYTSLVKAAAGFTGKETLRRVSEILDSYED